MVSIWVLFQYYYYMKFCGWTEKEVLSQILYRMWWNNFYWDNTFTKELIDKGIAKNKEEAYNIIHND